MTWRSQSIGYAKYSANRRLCLDRMTPDGILRVRWKSGTARGYTDLFPLEWFDNNGERKGSVHLVQDGRGKRYRAKCDVTVKQLRADLNYEPYRAFNVAQGMELGILRLHFADSDRLHISRAEWKPADATGFVAADVRLTEFELPHFGQYRPNKKPSSKVMRPRRERPRQRSFRKVLTVIYGGRCCISGCAIPEALEGAHIEPYTGPTSDHPQNGLLLRRDLHALFDAGLLRVEPKSRAIHLDPRVADSPDYKELDGRKLGEPVHRYRQHRPKQIVLLLRWQGR